MEILTNPVKGLLDILNPFSENFFLKSLFSWLNPVSEDFILKNLLDWLNPFSENFILKQLWDFLTNIVSYINPFSDNFLGKKIVDLIGDLLNKLFIPQQDHFTELDTNFKSKLGFVEQIKVLVFDLFNLNDEEGYEGTPNWSINYQGVEVDIIDWTAFKNFRGVLHSIIIFILWASFLIRTFKRIPKIIHGYDDK